MTVINSYKLSSMGKKAGQEAHKHALSDYFIVHDGIVYELDAPHGYEALSGNEWHTAHDGFNSTEKGYHNHGQEHIRAGDNGALLIE